MVRSASGKRILFGSTAIFALAGPIVAQVNAEPSCAAFQDAGPPTEVIIEDEGPRSSPPASFDPAVSVRLVYPQDYQAWPFSLEPGEKPRRQSGENFVMRMDGGPLPWSMRHTLAGEPIKPSDMPSSFRFLLHDRYSVEKVIAGSVRIMTGLPWSFDMAPIELRPSQIDGLFEILNRKTSTWERKRTYVAQSGTRFTDFFRCDTPMPGRFPQCQHLFDYRNIDVTASYGADNVVKWNEIKDIITSFISCIYIEEIPAKSGELIWD